MNSEYTGFTTQCRKCGQHVKTTYTGKTPEGVASYLITCGCKEEPKMKRVVIESPYAGKSDNDIKLNEAYGELCMRDCLTNHNEAPYASHLLYTRKLVLEDKNPEQRKLGIAAGFFWRDVAELTVFYIDLGMTKGMEQGIDDCKEKGKEYVVRHLPPDLWAEYSKFELELRELPISTLRKIHSEI